MNVHMDRRAFVSKALLGGLMGAAGLAAFPRVGESAVDVHIGINLPAPPRLVAVPSAPAVAYAPSVRANYFRYGSRYYVYDGGWYVSRAYNGPWAVIAPEYVPRPILAVPVRYYRRPPPDWRGWRRDAPPRWENRWGRDWDERRGRGVRYDDDRGRRDRRRDDDDRRHR